LAVAAKQGYSSTFKILLSKDKVHLPTITTTTVLSSSAPNQGDSNNKPQSLPVCCKLLCL